MDRSRIKRQSGAFVLGFLTVFLVLSLLSFDRGDPPSGAVLPANDPVHNWCGPVGAAVVYVLLSLVGVGLYVLVLLSGVCAVMILRDRPIEDPALRGIGVALVVIATSALGARACPAFLSPLPVGSGGYLGMAVTGFLEGSFSGVGTYLMLLATLAIGLLLWADRLLIGLATGATRAVRDLLAPLPEPVAATSSAAVAEAGRAAGVSPPLADDNRGLTPPARSGDTIELVPDEADPQGPADEEPREEAEPIHVRPPFAVPLADAEPEADEADAGDETPFEPDPDPDPDPESESEPGSTLDVRTGMQETPVAGHMPTAREEADETPYRMPTVDLLDDPKPFPFSEHERLVREKATILEKTLKDFGLTVKVVGIDTGPVITQFEVALEAGLRVNRVLNLDRDLAIALKATSVRVVAPLPGKNTVGIEVPNAKRTVVGMKEVMQSCQEEAAECRLPLYLGKDASGKPLVYDLTDLPHLLIAGRTGSGKSVCINAFVMSLLFSQSPYDCRMLMVDPKMVELAAFKKIPHLMAPLVTDMKKAEAVLAWAVDKMDERYDLLHRAGVRSIVGYNRLGAEEVYRRFNPQSDEERVRIPEHMPYIVIIIDELADLMMTSGKEVELYVTRLAQKSRAVGIHLILATQRPSVDVITGLIKSNLPARLSFQVATRVDSRTVLDEIGADKLLGNGDMLFTNGAGTPIRAQGTYLSDEEIKRVVNVVETKDPDYNRELVQLRAAEGAGKGKKPSGSKRDDLYDEAVKVVIMNQRGSVSLLQRALEIGYSRSARLIDMMAEDGIVGDYQGSQAREVLFSIEEWDELEKERAEKDEG